MTGAPDFNALVASLGAQTPAEVKKWLTSTQTVLGSINAAIDAHGTNVDLDFQALVSLTDEASGLPIIGTYAGDVEKALIIARFVIKYGKPITDKDPNYNAPAGGDGVATA